MSSMLALLALSCQEKRVVEPAVPGGDRVVLLEEFTGKGCTNCPKGNREIENLLSIFGENLVVVSIHSGFFANPDFFDLGQFDLRAEQSDDLFAYLSPNVGYPAGAVNRVPFDGIFQHGANEWAALITAQLAREPTVELSTSVTYDPTSRRGTISVTGVGKRDIAGDIRITVMLIEDGIIDAQDDIEAGGIVEDYEHNHVLRDMTTPFDGEFVANGLIVGQPLNAEYTFEVSEDWNQDQMHLVTFVAQVVSDDEIAVQQAMMTSLQD